TVSALGSSIDLVDGKIEVGDGGRRIQHRIAQIGEGAKDKRLFGGFDVLVVVPGAQDDGTLISVERNALVVATDGRVTEVLFDAIVVLGAFGLPTGASATSSARTGACSRRVQIFVLADALNAMHVLRGVVYETCAVLGDFALNFIEVVDEGA